MPWALILRLFTSTTGADPHAQIDFGEGSRRMHANNPTDQSSRGAGWPLWSTRSSPFWLRSTVRGLMCSGDHLPNTWESDSRVSCRRYVRSEVFIKDKYGASSIAVEEPADRPTQGNCWSRVHFPILFRTISRRWIFFRYTTVNAPRPDHASLAFLMVKYSSKKEHEKNWPREGCCLIPGKGVLTSSCRIHERQGNFHHLGHSFSHIALLFVTYLATVLYIRACPRER